MTSVSKMRAHDTLNLISSDADHYWYMFVPRSMTFKLILRVLWMETEDPSSIHSCIAGQKSGQTRDK